MLTTITSPSILTITPENKKYVSTCLDHYFKLTRFIDNCHANGRKLKTGLLESTIYDLNVFKKLWKRFQDRFTFKKYKGIRLIGTLERGVEGDSVGMLHAHLTLDIPADTPNEAIHGKINAELRRIWSELHEEETGVAVGGKRMAIEDPEDGDGEDWVRYSAKAFNRGEKPARWDSEGNESFLLTANVRYLKLWQRNELPSRNKLTRELALQRFNRQRPDVSGTLRSQEAA